MLGKELSILLLNVHSWMNPFHESNFEGILSFFKEQTLDIILLNEVFGEPWNEKLAKTARGLGDEWISFFGPAHGAQFGNGILVRSMKCIFQNTPIKEEKKEDRACLTIKLLNLPGILPEVGELGIFLVHLHHVDEHTRLKQLQKLFKIIEESELSHFLIAGDFNSVTRQDYSDLYYHSNVFKVREKNSWELPQFEVTNQLKADYIDCFQQLNQQNLMDENVATCSFGTRVDYFWASRVLGDKLDWDQMKCHTFPEFDLSDHSPLFLKLYFK